MIVVTTDSIAGKRIVKTLGLARGNTVRARHLGRDIMAALRGIVGGEVHEYTKLLAESREQRSITWWLRLRVSAQTPSSTPFSSRPTLPPTWPSCSPTEPRS